MRLSSKQSADDVENIRVLPPLPQKRTSPMSPLSPEDPDTDVHLIICIAGMGARKGHFLSDSLLSQFGKWFDINKCQSAMKDTIQTAIQNYGSEEIKKKTPKIIVKSIDYCSVVREEGGYNDKLGRVSMKSGAALLRMIANESMIDVLMYNSEKIKKQILAESVRQINDIFDELEGIPLKTVSFVGHSLGSVVAFDVLHQNQESGKTLLKIQPNFCFLVGSPLGLFLTMDFQTQQKQMESFNYLNPKTGKKQLLKEVSVYHLYHPYDPVAYRLDPHLDPKFSNYDPFELEFFVRRSKGSSLPVVQLTNAFNQVMLTLGVTKKPDDNYKRLLQQYEIVDHALPVMSEVVVNEYLNAGDVHLKYWSNTEVNCFILEKLEVLKIENKKQCA